MRALCFAIVALICTGCADVGGLINKPPAPPDPHTQMVALETRIAELIQIERNRIEPAAKPLAIDTELVGIARQVSNDMAAKNYFANKSPTGDSAASLIMSQDENFQGLLGENIAAQHYNAAGVDVEAFAKRFVETWMTSPAHKENLAFKDYTRTGVGAAVNGDTVYVTQLFASDLGLPPPEAQHMQRKKRDLTELPHPKSEDAKPAVPAYAPIPRPSLSQ